MRKRLLEELGKAEEVRNPAVPVVVWLLLDAREHDGYLLGWATDPTDPNGTDDGLRGLVVCEREYVAGFFAESLLGAGRAGPAAR